MTFVSSQQTLTKQRTNQNSSEKRASGTKRWKVCDFCSALNEPRVIILALALIISDWLNKQLASLIIWKIMYSCFA